MALNDEIIPYLDGNGLVCNIIPPAGTIRGSDNGVLFSSQLLHLLNNSTQEPYLSAILKCIGADGQLHRAPDDTSVDAPDDHYGFLSLGVRPVKLAISNMQPMLLYMNAMVSPRFCRLFSPIAGMIIALSNLNEDPSDTSNKLLTWTTIQGLQKRSLFCRLGGAIWRWRMRRIYGSTQAIAKIYFGASHPFTKYWIE